MWLYVLCAYVCWLEVNKMRQSIDEHNVCQFISICRSSINCRFVDTHTHRARAAQTIRFTTRYLRPAINEHLIRDRRQTNVVGVCI